MLRPPIRALLTLSMIFFVTACAPATTPTPFRPPTQVPATKILPTITSVPPINTIIPTLPLTATVTGPCTNDLQFISDVTIEDNTSVLPNSSIDKQWLVQNTGTCNWDETYQLKWMGGDPLGAVQEQAIFPARAGTQAVLRIIFIAPGISGTYESSWQAMSPDGNLFGKTLWIKIDVE